MKLLIAIIVVLLFQEVQLVNFCSMTCGKTGCTGISPTNCGSCQTNWSLNNTSCDPNSALNWYYGAKTSDLGGTLTVSLPFTNTACGSYGLYSWSPSGASGIITVSSTGITTAFYSMTAYVGIISADVRKSGGGGCGGTCFWQWSTIYTLEFYAGGSLILSSTQKLSSKDKNQFVCYDTQYNEYYNRMTQIYSTFNQSNTPLSWSIYNNQTNTSALWGIKQFIVIIRPCNVLCTSCWGMQASQCWSCTAGNWLSGTTCAANCLTKYGQVNDGSFICILCDPLCQVCYNTLSNCSVCTASGNYSSFLYIDYLTDPYSGTCMKPCLPGFFGNFTTRTCDPCDIACYQCVNSAKYCTSCATGYAWTGYYCYNPCPQYYYLQPSGTNCTKCYSFCSVCIGPFDVCTQCMRTGPTTSYLDGTSCLGVCLAGKYPDTNNSLGPNLCLPCDTTKCATCTGNPTPCQSCVSGYFLYMSTCVDICPAGTFNMTVGGSGVCLNCSIVCVGLTIKMYFPSITHEQIFVDMIFSDALDFSTFPKQTFQNITISSSDIQYSLSMFNWTYEVIRNTTYRIKIAPLNYIFLYNATFTVTTMFQPATLHTSISGMPFKVTNYNLTASLNWFLIKGPPYSNLQMGIMTSFSTLSTKTNSLLTRPYVQEIKKSGLFLLLFSGAQITSCSALSNQIQSQNLYEGVRFWAVFVFFDIPPYEQISDKTKHFVSPTVQDQIRNAQQINLQQPNRQLFSTNVMYWRFQRTGQTSFFIYDCYIQIFMLVGCWIGLYIAYRKRKQKWFIKHAQNIYSAVHKLHEISIMYVTMAAIVQFIYFQSTSFQRIISAVLCVIFNLYFIFYELYIYYDMIRYPLAEIGNKFYDYYVIRYGFFLKNIRYQQFDWTPRHWLRPYNFHILSYYKKFVMIISLPLFYSTKYAQMVILSLIQLFQLLRVYHVRPFVSQNRNYIRIILQSLLFLFFIINLIQVYLLERIMQVTGQQLGFYVKIFYGLGWCGFLTCFIFNLGHVIISIYDLCVGLKVSNRQKMDNARKKYYYSKIKSYQKDNEGASKDLIHQWIRLGNVHNRQYGFYDDVNVRIQEISLKKVLNKFEFHVKKICSLKMKKKKKMRKQNSTTAGRKIQKNILLSQDKYPHLYSALSNLYSQYEGPHLEVLILKTFLNVDQSKYQENQNIPFERSNMFQKIQMLSYDAEKEQKTLEFLVEGYPLEPSLFDQLNE